MWLSIFCFHQNIHHCLSIFKFEKNFTSQLPPPSIKQERTNRFEQNKKASNRRIVIAQSREWFSLILCFHRIIRHGLTVSKTERQKFMLKTVPSKYSLEVELINII